jgi:hypothetical protein
VNNQRPYLLSLYNQANASASSESTQKTENTASLPLLQGIRAHSHYTKLSIQKKHAALSRRRNHVTRLQQTRQHGFAKDNLAQG